MLVREQVLSVWTELKKTFYLSPADKSVYKSLKCSQTNNFNFRQSNIDLDELERQITAEMDLGTPDTENDMILELWLAVFNHGSTILDWIQLRKIVQGNYFQLSKIHAYLTRSDVVDMARRISFEEVMREMKRIDNFWNKISNWDKSFADSEDNPNLSFVIYEDYDPNKPTIEEVEYD